MKRLALLLTVLLAGSLAISSSPATASAPPAAPTQATVVSCASRTSNPPGTGTVSPSAQFTLIKRGYVHQTVWTFWFTDDDGDFYALLAGSGSSAQCLRGGGGGNPGTDELSVVQFPGRPVLFLYGFLDGCPHCSAITKITLSVINRTADATIRSFGATAVRTVLAELANLPCARDYTGRYSYPYSVSELAGKKSVGGGGGSARIAPGASACVGKLLGYSQ